MRCFYLGFAFSLSLLVSAAAGNERRLAVSWAESDRQECMAAHTIAKASAVPPVFGPNMFGWNLEPHGFTALDAICWKFTYPMCGGTRQSPQNIITGRRLQHNDHGADHTDHASGHGTDHTPTPAPDHSSDHGSGHGTDTNHGESHTDHGNGHGADHTPTPAPDHGSDHGGAHGGDHGGDHSGDHSGHATPAPTPAPHDGHDGDHSGHATSAPTPAPHDGHDGDHSGHATPAPTPAPHDGHDGDHSGHATPAPTPTPHDGHDGDHSGHATPAPTPAPHDGHDGDHSGHGTSAPTPAPGPGAPTGLMANIDYNVLTSKPEVIVDNYFKSVRIGGDFGVLHTARGDFKAKYVHFVTKSLHELDGQSKQVEMMIFHQLNEPAATWNPEPSTGIDTIIVSVLLDDVGVGSSPLLEAIGFTANEIVLNTDWHNKAKTQGMLQWDTVSLSDHVKDALSGDFYSYHGSLPVPPCWENVIYYVSDTVLPVSHEQVQGLVDVIRRAIPEYTPRPVQPPQKVVVMKNEFSVPGFNGNWAAASCPDLPTEEQEVTAVCWMCPEGVRKSPVNLVEDEAAPLMVAGVTQVAASEGFTVPRFNYHPVAATSVRGRQSVVVRPQKGFNFGHIELGGRFYTAKMITLHAVSGMHTINGESFDGEIHIHHYVFGDWFDLESEREEETEEADRRRMDAFRGNTRESDQAIEGGASYQVIVAIPLKVTTNPSAKSMDDLMPNSLREMPFAAHDDFKAIFEGDFLQYEGTLIYPKCSDKLTHWIVYKTPLKVNKVQVYTEYPTRSGFDTTPSLATRTDLVINKNVVPFSAMGSGRSCSEMGPGDWTYSDAHCWGEIKKPDPNDDKKEVAAYPTCGESSRRQSPVHLESSNVVNAAGGHQKEHFLNYVKYHPMLHLQVTNTGHSLEIADRTNGKSHLGLGYLTYGDHYYFVRQFQVHFPSEHVTDGRQHAAELQIVHQMQAHWGAEAFEGKAANEVLVAAIMFDIGTEESPLLKQMLPTPGEEVGIDWVKTLQEPLDLMRHLGPILDGDYFRYDGSFTTPPCSEIIKWFVFKQSLSMSMEQWNTFKDIFANPANARPVQPLYERNVAMNTFKAPGETWDFKKWEYYLDRNHGRNRDEPSSFIVLGGIVGAVVIALLIMYATFIPQNTESLKSSAGGLNAETTTFMGRSLGPYGRLSDNRV